MKKFLTDQQATCPLSIFDPFFLMMSQKNQKFCTTINCMDGRTQEPVIAFLKKHFNATYVDSITEPGPVAILTGPRDTPVFANILKRLDISVYHHKSVGLAIVAHHDCAGNPVTKEQQLKQLAESVKTLQNLYPSI
ncbi:MAG TPA: carbonic anhydrase, partial [bacterium]|nr:carbonic anhydrase [bacterium]